MVEEKESPREWWAEERVVRDGGGRGGGEGEEFCAVIYIYIYI